MEYIQFTISNMTAYNTSTRVYIYVYILLYSAHPGLPVAAVPHRPSTVSAGQGGLYNMHSIV